MLNLQVGVCEYLWWFLGGYVFLPFFVYTLQQFQSIVVTLHSHTHTLTIFLRRLLQYFCTILPSQSAPAPVRSPGTKHARLEWTAHSVRAIHAHNAQDVCQLPLLHTAWAVKTAFSHRYSGESKKSFLSCFVVFISLLTNAVLGLFWILCDQKMLIW